MSDDERAVFPKYTVGVRGVTEFDAQEFVERRAASFEHPERIAVFRRIAQQRDGRGLETRLPADDEREATGEVVRAQTECIEAVDAV